MTYPLNNFEAGRLAANARSYRPDPLLDRLADQQEAGDLDAVRRLPRALQSQVDVHMDLRSAYRAAVAARVVPDDRGPSAA